MKFAGQFWDTYKIDVWDAKYGAWWAAEKNQGLAGPYNEIWEKFLADNHTLEEVLKFGRDLAKEFGFKTIF